MPASFHRTLLGLALPGGSGARLSVLGYHRVLPQTDPLLGGDPTADEFARTMEWVKDAFNVVPLADGVAALGRGTLPKRALAITFDDGYANNETIAAPVLQRLGLPATFFIATGFLDGGRMFNDTVVEAVRAARGEELDLDSLGLGRHSLRTMAERRSAVASILGGIKYRALDERVALAEQIAERAGAELPRDLMMTSEQAARLARMGFELGGHTVNHPILARLPEADARRELEQNRRRLHELAGRPARFFAYPNGSPGRDYTAETVRLVREAGFEGAVTASPGAARRGTDPFQIPRFTPWDTAPLRFVLRMLNNAMRVEPRLLPVGVTTTTGTQ